jgi:hypothetical protein
MISRRLVEEYRRMNSTDRTSFRQWLTLNTVFGACAFTLIAMIAINAAFSGMNDDAGLNATAALPRTLPPLQ